MSFYSFLIAIHAVLALGLSGCSLVVDFDRTLLVDAGVEAGVEAAVPVSEEVAADAGVEAGRDSAVDDLPKDPR